MLYCIPHQADRKKPLIFDMHFQKYRIFWHIMYQGLYFIFGASDAYRKIDFSR